MWVDIRHANSNFSQKSKLQLLDLQLRFIMTHVCAFTNSQFCLNKCMSLREDKLQNTKITKKSFKHILSGIGKLYNHVFKIILRSAFVYKHFVVHDV